MRRLLLATAFCLATLPAAAQLRDGVYEVEGTNPNGTTYTGALQLRATPAGTWEALWAVGELRIPGIGIIHAGVLSVAYLVDGRPGVASYEVRADGKLSGAWSMGTGMGTEVLTPR